MLLRLPVLLLHKITPNPRIIPPSDAASAGNTPHDAECRAANGTATATTTATAPENGPRQEGSSRHWARIPERGSQFGMRLLVLSCRLFGTRVTSIGLYPIVAYFLLTGHAARAASLHYFTRLRHAAQDRPTPRPGWGSAYRQMLAFAQAGLDKLAAWSGQIRAHEVSFDDETAFSTLIESGRGALVIGAHLGNLEMVRALAVRGNHVKVTAVVYTEHARRFNSVLASVAPQFTHHLVEVSDFGPHTAIMLQERVDAGELIVIVGDRVPTSESGRTVDVRFLGDSAPFAQGPFVLAHALACPVYLFFSLREASGYRLYFEPFADRIVLPRAARLEHLRTWAQRYAARLEHFCYEAPYQWFNFFDFWTPSREKANDSR
jgi:predicted LPLAT superfamily acyltransferase